MTKVLIGIQARSQSERLPRKGHALIGGETLMRRVLTPCQTAARYLTQSDVPCVVAVLIPENDELKTELAKLGAEFMEGPHLDVLARYRMSLEKYEPDYVVRITGDCPLISPYTITHMVRIAITNRYDYVTNADERFRTSFDGADCEVVSKALLEEAHLRADDPADREHVTTWIKRAPPSWARMGFICGFIDQSDIKLSVDTAEDLERVRKVYESAYEKYQKACLAFGKQNVIRQ